MSDEGATPSQRTAKKLPFKATALRKAASLRAEIITNKKELESDGLDLFRRSKEMEPIVAADQERRLKKKRRHDDQRRKSAESSARRLPRYTICELVTPPALKSSKRTRLFSTPSDLIPDNPPFARLLLHSEQASVGGPGGDTLTPSLLPNTSLDSDDDDDDDDDLRIAPKPTKRRGSVNPIESSFIAGDEDDEFATYIRKAEEQRALDQALLGVRSDGAASKAKIDILVTSIVPETKPCCFRFLFDKELRVARNTWLALQKRKGMLLDVEREDDIVLTWRRKKVYAFSTLLNLGIRPQDNGRAVSDGNDAKGFANGRTRVHMEAWTLGLFREMEREEELKRKRETTEVGDDEEPAPVEEEPPASEVKTRVILKARGIADVKLTVKLTVRRTTTVETLITGFRTQRSIVPDRDVQIWFDGDRLEEHATMDEAEIDDMDTLEVHVK
ncbi:ubiquitin supergroup [Pochonia chlamydosporia 170]|uniref:Ubiquitin supergroup n=1 Tax=Pochonia chlamydosporia 170 TaxID=1380566 RepID=A0A179EYE9_METCM|nr:ubiquitin supergroup [Pochonia chlamydosporia 170]OAQ58225.1 ubiquitin supergroup [Pochonia chlamydosporia 170]